MIKGHTYNNNTTELHVNIANIDVHATIILDWLLYYWINISMVNNGSSSQIILNSYFVV